MKNIDFNALNPSILLGARKIHFIGIGGIGVSALARMMLQKGNQVSGSDRSESMITKELERAGATVFIGQKEEHITKDIDAVIYTIAVPDDNPELKKARELTIPTISYPEALGIISRGMFTIAVSGTHGKTTTTAMIAKILTDAGKGPTVIVGSLLQDGKTNFIQGKSDMFVVEACEYKRSFLHLNPNVLVITNIDNDHLDYYKDVADIQSAFNELARKVPKDGGIITNPNDELIIPALKHISGKVIDYTKEDTENIQLSIKGTHNVLNAQAALAAARATSLDISRDVALKALHDFKGTWRRFEYKGKTKAGTLVYDDYAHHPTAITVTLRGARESYPDKKIIVIFQPHLYSRTNLLMDEFARSFQDAGEVIVVPTYAAREADETKDNASELAEHIKEHNSHTRFFNSPREAAQYIQSNTGENDVLFTMGAGDIYKIGKYLTGVEQHTQAH